MRFRYFTLLILFSLVTLWLLSGCAPFIDQVQMQIAPESHFALTKEQSVGQTFVARRSGLEGYTLWLSGEVPADTIITLHLRAAPQATENLRTDRLAIGPGVVNGWHHFSFAPIANSQNTYYYVMLESVAPFQVGAGTRDSYLDGALYQNDLAMDAQMAFQLAYRPGYMAVEFGQATVINVGWLSVAFLLYVVPGWAIWAWLWRGRTLHWVETLCMAIGLSLAIYPLLFLWTHMIGLNLGVVYAWLPPLLGILALIRCYKDWRPRLSRTMLQRWWMTELCWADITLILIAGLGLAVRLYVIQGLEIPMWGDSYQHTMIAQLLVDRNGLFDSWMPYAPIPTFTYHFGLHSLVAVFHWATRMPIPQAMLWCTQWLNFCAGLVLYLLAAKISVTPWGKVGSVLIAGLLTSMPMFYINWGRYTQLAGQVLLPVVIWLTWELWETQHWSLRHYALGWLLVSGLMLTHYRVSVFYVVFVAIMAGYALWQRTWRQDWGKLVILSIGSAGLILPWFFRTLSGKLLTITQAQLARQPAQVVGANSVFTDLSTYLTSFLWLLLVVSVTAGLWERKKAVLMLYLWWCGLLLVSHPNWLRLPGSGIIGGFTVLIAAYIFASLLIPAWLETWHLADHLRQWRGPVLCVVLTGLGLWGAPLRLQDVKKTSYALVTRPDIMAMQWIREHTPPDSVFMINGFFAFNDKAVVGSDGGWWLPLLADRANVIPPLSYTLESEPWEDYRADLCEFFAFIQTHGIDDTDTISLLRARGVTHIYIGQQQGRINYQGRELLPLSVLSQSRNYHLLYHQDHVWIFALR
jgi:hypothetical protein